MTGLKTAEVIIDLPDEETGMTSKQDLIEAIRRLPDTTSEASLSQIAEKIADIQVWEEDGVA
jgi:hypothetical protein